MSGDQLTYSPWPFIVGVPIAVQQLGRRTTVEQLPRTVEPTTDADLVVRPHETAHDKGKETETACDRIRCGPSTCQIAAGT